MTETSNCGIVVAVIKKAIRLRRMAFFMSMLIDKPTTKL